MVDHETLDDLCRALGIERPAYAKPNELMGQAGS
jgi:hypothetical protein